MNPRSKGSDEARRPWQSYWRPRELGAKEYHQEFVAPFAERDRARASGASAAARAERKGCCAGSLSLFMAVGTAVTTTVTQVWPF